MSTVIDFGSKACKTNRHYSCHGSWIGMGFRFNCNCHCHINKKEIDGRSSPTSISCDSRHANTIEVVNHNLTLKEILNEIKEANGSQISFNAARESAPSKYQFVRDYLGEKLTSRENKKVRKLSQSGSEVFYFKQEITGAGCILLTPIKTKLEDDPGGLV